MAAKSMTPQEKLDAIADMEFLISYQLSMLSFDIELEIKSIAIKKEDVNSHSEGGPSALMYASVNNNLDMVKLLVKKTGEYDER